MCNCSGFQFCGDCSRSSQCTSALPGIDGLNGKTVLTGTTDPTAIIGVDGDFYISKASPFKFFYKENGQWAYLGNLKGVDGNGFFAVQKLTLTQSQIQNLYSAPVEILPAMPSGFIYTIQDAIFKLNYNGNTWANAGGGSMVIRYRSSTTYQLATAGNAFLTAGSSYISRAGAYNNFTNSNIPTGSAVDLWWSNGNPTGSGGTVDVQLVYHIWSV